MKEETMNILKALSRRFPSLQPLEESIAVAAALMRDCFLSGGTLYLCGNGGSACRLRAYRGRASEKLQAFPSFAREIQRSAPFHGRRRQAGRGENGRRASVVSLCGHPAFATAYANDKDAAFVYAQQICALGRDKDVLLAVSTSGNSVNCLYAVLAAKAKGMKTILLTGGMGGAIGKRADLSLIVPEKETYRVQELHLPVYHCICAMLENEFFS